MITLVNHNNRNWKNLTVGKLVSNSRSKSVSYGAPFVACTLLLTEANFVQQKSLLSNKSHFSLTKVILSMTKEILSTTKLLLSDKS